MQWNPKKTIDIARRWRALSEWRHLSIVAIAALAIFWLPLTHAEENEAILHWKNGDSLPGQLLESKLTESEGKIHWSSPHFSDVLVVDANVLDSVVFPKQSVPVTETFRVGTIYGDIWMAALIGSDDTTLRFSSERHGEFRVKRELIYTLESREHSNLLFDGSQLTAWKLPEEDKADGGELLFSQEVQPSWHADRGGRPQTNTAKANIFYAFEWPERFEIDLELASTARPPSFVFALGKNLYETVRLETWVNELVVVQGTLFEPVLTIEPERRNFRLRIAYDQNAGDENSGVLKVLDLNGNVLLKLEGVKPTVEAAGLYIYNRGQDLTVQRLRIYRQATEVTNRQIDDTKTRVHTMRGEIVPGKLFVEKNGNYVLDTDGTRRDIDLEQIDRVVQPGITLEPTEQPTALSYVDGTILRGQTTQLNADSVQLQTAFADKPITSTLAGASLLKFESTPETETPVEDYDKLFYESGSLRGYILFDSKDMASLRWQPVGASKAVRLANIRGTRVERALERVSKQKPFDTEQFPHLLHLKNGEVIPCQILSYDETRIGFQSPFIMTQSIDSVHVKGIEFAGRKTRARTENRNPITITGGKGKHRVILEDGRILNAITRRAKDGKVEIIILSDKKEEQPKLVKVEGEFAVNDAAALKRGVELIFDPLETRSRKLDVKLERALTVPRFSRENPPNHILVANNGDVKRGTLLGINGQTIQFDSKLRKFVLPIDRIARVVDVSENSPQSSGISHQLEEGVSSSTENYSPEIRITLIDSPILIFEPLEFKEGKLLGRSSIYQEVSVPIDNIQYLHFGEKAKSFKSVYEEWVVRSAKEPAYGDDH